MRSSPSTPEQPFEGVLQGPFGSAVRNQYKIDNADNEDLFSEEGQQALKAVLTQYRDAGATIGGAPTFRLTNLRAGSEEKGKWNKSAEHPELDPRFRAWNQAAVRIAREVYGERMHIVGLLAPIADTSGGDDADWKRLGRWQRTWVKNRQRPQVETLLAAGVDTLFIEAGRYLEEAKAVAQLVAEGGGKRLAFSFEAHGPGFPDPAHSQLRFDQAKEMLQHASHGLIEILVGINCIGATAARRFLDAGNVPDIVYPNQIDLERAGATADDFHRFGLLAETMDRTPAEEEAFRSIQARLTTTETEFREIWNCCLQARVRVIGVCCGGTPGLVQAARQTWDQHQRVSLPAGNERLATMA